MLNANDNCKILLRTVLSEGNIDFVLPRALAVCAVTFCSLWTMYCVQSGSNYCAMC